MKREALIRGLRLLPPSRRILSSKAPLLRLLFGSGALGLLLAQIACAETRQSGEQAVGERLSAICIPSVANSGQTNPEVDYYAPTFAGTVFVTRDAVRESGASSHSFAIFLIPGHSRLSQLSTVWL